MRYVPRGMQLYQADSYGRRENQTTKVDVARQVAADQKRARRRSRNIAWAAAHAIGMQRARIEAAA